ncbi:MAG TPA: PKD domain-containing protein, partial [Bacteroidales bacterium]|nr:PKD domain-containing protein [Bacteroidales bacterium]
LDGNGDGVNVADSTILDIGSNNITISQWFKRTGNSNFGDGSVSTDQNPVHTYTKDGSYKVSLITGTIAANCKDISEQVVVIGDNNCNASFTYYIDEASKRVTFQGVEDPNYMHTWEFPDGTVITDAMPVVPFAKKLIGKVKHSILNVANNCSDFYEQTIQFGFNSDDCEADFFYVPQELSVTFTSTTAGNIVKYVWNFGDGTISTEANPVLPIMWMVFTIRVLLLSITRVTPILPVKRLLQEIPFYAWQIIIMW